MKIQHKILVAMLCGFIVVGLLLYGSMLLLTRGFNQMEHAYVQEKMAQFRSALEWESGMLNGTLIDWAHWDETYNWVLGSDEDYLDRNLIPWTFQYLNVNLFAYFNSENELMGARAYDIVSNRSVTLSDDSIASLEQYINANSLQATKGVFSLAEGPLLFATQPILTSSAQGPAVGTMLLGRLLNAATARRLTDLTSNAVTLYPYPGQGLDSVLSGATRLGDGVYLGEKSHHLLMGYARLDDVFGEPSVIAKLEIPRVFYPIALTYIQSVLGVFLLIALILPLVTWLYVGRDIIGRLVELGKEFRLIGDSKTLSSRINVAGRDEIAFLGRQINQMLELLEIAQKELRENDETLRTVMDNMSDVLFMADMKGKILYVSPSVEGILGYHPDSVVGSPVIRYIQRGDRRRVLQTIRRNLKDRQIRPFDIRCISAGGQEIWLQAGGKITSYRGRPTAIFSCRDITKNKEDQARIEYLSSHDYLTGLHNRAYVEEQFAKVNKDWSIPYSVILGDLNGLKLVNDTFGHEAGDELLVTAAQLLKQSCRPADIVVRWGGDEFLLVLPGATEKAAERVIHRIKDACMKATVSQIQTSLALGAATASSSTVAFFSVIQEAEEKMYRHKLLESKHARNAIISSLRQTLDARTHETKEHGERMRELALAMGRRLGLDSGELDELELLALLHDIGKVGIPHSILDRTDKLSPREQSLLESHTEIGYRIAATTPELTSIAESILSHHERWDGSGYPQGLRGQEIPFKARIISIVDAYDTLTASRGYSQAERASQALAELESQRGTLFDPELVQVFVALLADQVLPRKIAT